LEVFIIKDFKSMQNGSAHSKGVTGGFFGSAYSKGVRSAGKRWRVGDIGKCSRKGYGCQGK
jgi:hypothetical protein